VIHITFCASAKFSPIALSNTRKSLTWSATLWLILRVFAHAGGHFFPSGCEASTNAKPIWSGDPDHTPRGSQQQVPISRERATRDSARRHLMKARTFKLLTRTIFSVAVLCLGSISSSAQTTKPSQPAAQTTSQSAAQKDTKKLTPPPGKLRGITNEMRMAAAIRTADRKSQAKMKASATPTEVK